MFPAFRYGDARAVPAALAALIMVSAASAGGQRPGPATGMASIPAGQYVPLYSAGAAQPVQVAAFQLDRHAVTRGEFLAFVQQHPGWRRDRIRLVFADDQYLASWRTPLAVGERGDLARPVTEVSWFAARAYCANQGKRLPTVDEWEYVGQASESARNASHDPPYIARLVALYTTDTPERTRAHPGFRNAFGVAGMHGGPWEWTEDFNSVLVSADSRDAGGTARHTNFRAVCASAAIGASDPLNYPAFLRYAVRSALDARSTLDALGFRCAANA